MIKEKPAPPEPGLLKVVVFVLPACLIILSLFYYTNCTLKCRRQFQSLSRLLGINADATTKEHSEQSERMRHLVVKSVLLVCYCRPGRGVFIFSQHGATDARHFTIQFYNCQPILDERIGSQRFCTADLFPGQFHFVSYKENRNWARIPHFFIKK